MEQVAVPHRFMLFTLVLICAYFASLNAFESHSLFTKQTLSEPLNVYRTLSNIRSLIKCGHLCLTSGAHVCDTFSLEKETKTCMLSLGQGASSVENNSSMSPTDVYSAVVPVHDDVDTTPPLTSIPDYYVYNPVSDSCYMRYASHWISWDDAKEVCENLGPGTQFATFETRPSMKFLTDLYWSEPNLCPDEWNMVSVGLRRPDDDDEYYWNMNESLPLSYEDGWWNPPDNNGLCVRLYNVGSKFGFDDLPCSDLSRYLCEDTTCQWLNMAQELDIRGANRQDTNASLPAPDLYLYNPHSGTCYMRYSKKQLTWGEAKLACEDIGTQLATFETSLAASFIIDQYWGVSSDNCQALAWQLLNIGLHADAYGSWFWNADTCKPLSYSDRWMAAPNGDGQCVELYVFNGVFGFDDHPCSDTIGYLCEDVGCYWFDEFSAPGSTLPP